MTAADVHRLYPRAADFLAARKTWDPTGKFANTHLTELFGL
ncbi:D-arabinono-1,4-lactone oxidase [Caulobacter sp. DWR2-3-1b2]